MAEQALIPAEFFGHPVSILDHAGKRWLTAEEVGRCLGYSDNNSGAGVRNLYNRHTDEFTEADSCRINLMRQAQNREQLIFSATGCIKLGFFANTATAKQFRAWAAVALEAQAPVPVPVDEPLPAVVRSPRLEASMARMADSVATLADGMSVMRRQLDVTARYIGALELNQAGTRRITAEVAREACAMKAEGMSHADIARLLRISRSSVSLIVRDKYPVAIPETAPAPASASTALQGWIEREQAKLMANLDGGAS